MTVNHLLCVLAGANSLAIVHRFITDNADWLTSLLNIAPVLSAGTDNASSASRPVLPFHHQDTGTDAVGGTVEDFNPFSVFASIGSSQFNHVRPRTILCLSLRVLALAAVDWAHSVFWSDGFKGCQIGL